MGVETRSIKYKGVELDIEFYFSPEEPMVMYYSDGSGYPGSPAEVEIYTIEHCGVDVMELLDDQIDKIEEQLIKSIYDNRD